MAHLGAEELAAGLGAIRRAPAALGTLEMIVRRPTVDEREVVDEGVLTLDDGLVGDHWRARGSRSTEDGAADPDRQLTVMASRVVDLLAGGDRDGWPIAGDQLYVDLDLSEEHLPAGSRLAVGSAVLEIQAQPHTGCAQFSARFGSDALRLASSESGRALRLRGVNAVVVQDGSVRTGDLVRKL